MASKRARSPSLPADDSFSGSAPSRPSIIAASTKSASRSKESDEEADVEADTDARLSRSSHLTSSQPPSKKVKVSSSANHLHLSKQPDRLSALSDELLIRILHLLPVECVLICQSVSHRFHRLAGDAQVWKGLYWGRWVRPRVRMLPRMDGEKELLSDFSSRRSKWLDEGRLLHTGWDAGAGGGGDRGDRGAMEGATNGSGTGTGNENGSQGEGRTKGVKGTDWKARYKLRHNWSIGAAEVREIGLGLGLDPAQDGEDEIDGDPNPGGKTLMARLVDGGVVTVDIKEGLRAWDLKRRECVAQCALTSLDDDGRGGERLPTCLGVDSGFEGGLDTAVVVGFQDGGFEIWSLTLGGGMEKGTFERRYRRPPAVGRNEGDLDQDVLLSAIAYAHPYLLTITADHVLSLYVFDADRTAGGKDIGTAETSSNAQEDRKDSENLQPEIHIDFEKRLTDSKITAPRLLTSLKSHTCWPPLCLSIRSTPRSIIASIAYALPTYLSGWSVGLQELHLTRSGTILRSRLASAVEQGFQSLLSSSAPPTPSLSQSLRPTTPEASDTPGRSRSRRGRQTHPTSLSYSHPYLLAGNRDNTLSLYLVTSNNEELKISKNTTLWGHTSSVSGAHVGGRGKAVSISARGEELRVWELEGGLGRKVVQERSVLVRREGREGSDHEDVEGTDGECKGGNLDGGRSHDGQRRGWVGFNDEVVIVLKEEGNRGQALVVYDFT
jgi:hypothetical protein